MIINNERGVITVDYLFAMVLVMGFSFILFALSMTLTMAEVVQYMTYSSARTYFAAGLEEPEQRSRALNKFQTLRNSDTLSPLFGGGWFNLVEVTISSNMPGEKQELSGYAQEPQENLFHGTAVYFTSNVLEFSIPFYGSTANDEMRGQEEFGTWIGSYLGREVTEKECEYFFQLKPSFIKAAYSGAPDFSNTDMGADNGC